MEQFTQEIFKLVFGWWWFCKDGQTKTADTGDRYIMPILITLSLGVVIALVTWRLS